MAANPASMPGVSHHRPVAPTAGHAKLVLPLRQRPADEIRYVNHRGITTPAPRGNFLHNPALEKFLDPLKGQYEVGRICMNPHAGNPAKHDPMTCKHLHTLTVKVSGIGHPVPVEDCAPTNGLAHLHAVPHHVGTVCKYGSDRCKYGDGCKYIHLLIAH